MQIARTHAQLGAVRAALAASPRGGVALVPTMGALHAGHISLVRAAREAGYEVIASIFVNPTQFGPGEDFTRYPRDEGADCAMLEAAGCRAAWLPDVATMYPPDAATAIEVGGPARLWEGAMRPGHFRGVATVVATLFGQVRPDSAWFGEKDWQQVQVIRRMVRDLLLPVTIETAPTWREADGLAMSSRNRYLSVDDRARAPALFRALETVKRRLRAGDAVADVLEAASASLTQTGFTVDYLALVDHATLEPLDQIGPDCRLVAAARLETTRLLDNIAV